MMGLSIETKNRDPEVSLTTTIVPSLFDFILVTAFLWILIALMSWKLVALMKRNLMIPSEKPTTIILP